MQPVPASKATGIRRRLWGYKMGTLSPMLARLPEPDRTLLRTAPVQLVVFALNYGTAEAWAPNAGIRWRDGLKERGFDGKLLAANQQQWTIGAGVPAEARSRRGFQLTANDGVTATLYEDGVVLESRQYGGWPAYRDLIQTIMETTAEQRGISVQTSLSLRYVNALSDEQAKTAAYWHGKVQAPFLGPALDNELLEDFKRGLYLLTFNDGTVNAEVRVGVQPDAVFAGCVAFVFDMELTDAEPREFDVREALVRADDLNTAALKYFHRIVAPDYLRGLADA